MEEKERATWLDTRELEDEFKELVLLAVQEVRLLYIFYQGSGVTVAYKHIFCIFFNTNLFEYLAFSFLSYLI